MDVEHKKISQLKKQLNQCVNGSQDQELPILFFFLQEIGKPKYKITVEIIQEDHFVDSRGGKWMRVKEEK